MGINLRGWDNGERYINLDQVEFTYMGPLSRDSKFNIEACTAFKKKKVTID